MTVTQKIEVMQAYKEGRTIQCKPMGFKEWHPCEDPEWNWAEYEYRVV